MWGQSLGYLITVIKHMCNASMVIYSIKITDNSWTDEFFYHNNLQNL